MTARDIVPEPAAPRGFLRRRRTDEPFPHHPVVPVADAAPGPVVAAVRVPVEPPPAVVTPDVVTSPHVVPAPDTEDVPLFDDVANASTCTRCEERAEADDLFRAQASLLQAALRQADELEAALANEQHLRRQDTEQLHADNELLRSALAALNTDALDRQVTEAPRVSEPVGPRVPEQRDHLATVRAYLDPPPADMTLDAAGPDVTQRSSRHGRRRSGRQAGPA